MNIEKIKKALMKENISVSYRGDAIRVSPSVYNDLDEVQAFSKILIDLA